jgi:hypothetical protein
MTVTYKRRNFRRGQLVYFGGKQPTYIVKVVHTKTTTITSNRILSKYWAIQILQIFLLRIKYR